MHGYCVLPAVLCEDEFYLKISCHVISPKGWIYSDM